jgi:signal transduction histidine kinase
VRRPLRSLRARLTTLGFLAIYVPTLLLLTVTLVTEDEVVDTRDGTEIDDTSTRRSPWAVGAAVALGPVAGALAWWWAGRAVRPIERVRTVAEDIEASDLSRRIGLDDGPTEVVALAASFDAMLDRLQRAAEVQRRLVEETSHALRTPLSVLVTNADVVLADPRPTMEAYRRGIERSRSAATRLQAAVDDLLVDARGRARDLDRRPADLVGLARGVVEDLRALAAGRGVEVTLTAPPTAECPVDVPTVTRALANLVDNAVRHAPPGTDVDVRVDAAGPAATITVTDHGPGIPPDQQHRVFERFWRGRPNTPGTGLGLPIAHQVALAHGGDLTVRSPTAAGDGAAFTLSLARTG